MKVDYLDYLEDIVNAMMHAEHFIEGVTFEQFQKDNKTIFAVVRALEIVGEASGKIPKSVRKKYSQVPWQEIVGMRNKLIHEYFGINLKVVWDTVKLDIPSLKPIFQQILNEAGG